jgi:hypothetical protein
MSVYADELESRLRELKRRLEKPQDWGDVPAVYTLRDSILELVNVFLGEREHSMLPRKETEPLCAQSHSDFDRSGPGAWTGEAQAEGWNRTKQTRKENR